MGGDKMEILFVNVSKEPGRSHEGGLAVAETGAGIGNGTAVFRTGYGHIQQASLLLYLGGAFTGHKRRKKVFLYPDNIYIGKFKAFGGVDCHKRHFRLLLVTLAVLVSGEGHITYEVGHGHLTLVRLQPHIHKFFETTQQFSKILLSGDGLRGIVVLQSHEHTGTIVYKLGQFKSVGASRIVIYEFLDKPCKGSQFGLRASVD